MDNDHFRDGGSMRCTGKLSFACTTLFEYEGEGRYSMRLYKVPEEATVVEIEFNLRLTREGGTTLPCACSF